MTATQTAGTRTLAIHAAMYAGLVLTLAATIAPYVDRGAGQVLAHHIEHGYPTYTQHQVDAAVDAWIGILTLVGVLGIVCWGGAIWAVQSQKTWARPTATVLFICGAGLSLSALLIHDSSGEVGLAPLLGWIGMLPLVPGLAAVAMLWAAPPARRGPNQRS